MLRFRDMDEFKAWQEGGQPPGKAQPAVTGQVSGRMNKTEAAWAARLEAQKRVGDIQDYRFEGIKLRLADRTWYTPDFLLVHPNGSIELQEIKGGFVRDDGLLKFKVAREQFPMFQWSLLQRKRTQWLRVR